MGSSAEEIRSHVKVYLMIFAALLVLTLVTVGVSFLNVSIPMAIAIALVVAGIKGSLVACYFMHLISERGFVFWVLGICVVFFFALMFLPLITTHNHPLSIFIESVSGQRIGS